jgi:hypothetical protein
VKYRLVRLALAGGVALVVGAPAVPARAAACHPTFRPTCDAVCAQISSVCRQFG